MLILVGIVISALSGENGILQRASEAKEETERGSVIESARTDILGMQIENEEANITEEQLIIVLERYFVDVPTKEEIPDDLSTLILKTKRRIWNL